MQGSTVTALQASAQVSLGAGRPEEKQYTATTPVVLLARCSLLLHPGRQDLWRCAAGSVHFSCTAIVVRSPSHKCRVGVYMHRMAHHAFHRGATVHNIASPFFSKILTIEAADFDYYFFHNVLLLPLFDFCTTAHFLHLPPFAVRMPYPPLVSVLLFI